MFSFCQKQLNKILSNCTCIVKLSTAITTITWKPWLKAQGFNRVEDLIVQGEVGLPEAILVYSEKWH